MCVTRKPLLGFRVGRLGRVFASGFGACNLCETPWRFATHHVTDYSDHGGLFPLCENCWRDLAAPEARLPYYREMWRRWQQYGDPDHNGTPWPELWEQIRAAVMEGK